MLTVASSYNHTQTTPSSTWTIVHNMNVSAPVVDCYISIDGMYYKVIPQDVVVVDNTTIQVLWSQAYAGKARIV